MTRERHVVLCKERRFIERCATKGNVNRHTVPNSEQIMANEVHFWASWAGAVFARRVLKTWQPGCAPAPFSGPLRLGLHVWLKGTINQHNLEHFWDDLLQRPANWGRSVASREPGSERALFGGIFGGSDATGKGLRVGICLHHLPIFLRVHSIIVIRVSMYDNKCSTKRKYM